MAVARAARTLPPTREPSESVASEARYRGLLEAAPDAMVVVDQAGAIVLLNLRAETEFGYHRDELIGQPITKIIPEGFAERLAADALRSAAEVLAQEIGDGIELSGLRNDGTRFPIEILLSPLASGGGILVTAAIRNITKRKAAENRLLEAQKLESMGRLAGGIAHDFNNILFVIRGYAEMVAQDLGQVGPAKVDAASILERVEIISEATDRAAALVAQLLAFGRRQLVNPRILDLNDGIRAIEPMLRPLIGSDIDLVIRLDPAARRFRADPGQLAQIVVNLVVNARDAMPNGGRVVIETGNTTFAAGDVVRHGGVAAGDYVSLAVSDTGSGMDDETSAHIFEPFFTTKELGRGTGLGLATIYGIVQQAGGKIWVYSEPGLGSTFKLYFPSEDAAATEDVTAPSAHPASGTGTVLVVEDDPAIRRMATTLLERAGYRVVGASSGADALAAVAKLDFPVDVLVTDVVMPKMSGIALAEQMSLLVPGIGIVLMSGYTAEILDLSGVTSNGAIFVGKPTTSSELLAAIARARSPRSKAASVTGAAKPKRRA